MFLEKCIEEAESKGKTIRSTQHETVAPILIVYRVPVLMGVRPPQGGLVLLVQNPCGWCQASSHQWHFQPLGEI